MTWTTDTPTNGGWYWYQEDGINLNKPMPAWIFGTGGKHLYADLCAVHERQDFASVREVTTCKGRWTGPMETPQ